jgi:hypothetical protein
MLRRYSLFLPVCFAAAVMGAVNGGSDCAPSWDLAVGNPGLNDWVLGLHVHEETTGTAVYVGGGFSTAGGMAASRIARWDGLAWAPLGGGITAANGSVWAMIHYDEGSGPRLFAAGDFTSAGGVIVNRIARWDGRGWSSVGGGVNAEVRGALAVFDDGFGDGPCLYIGGDFTMAGSVAAKYIAKWNGEGWSDVGGGMGGVTPSVRALSVFDDGNGPRLYAGGGFELAGGVPAVRIARWDGKAWSVLGSGLNNWVRALAVHDDGSGGGAALYAGGDFTTAGGEPAVRIARWDGGDWSALGDGVNATVRSIASFDDGAGLRLYIGGDFTSTGGTETKRIAVWNGKAWSELGGGGNGVVHALAVVPQDSGQGSALVAAGLFTNMSDQSANRIARWVGCADELPNPDLNGDGVVNGIDLALLLAAWGRCERQPCAADLNSDGVVNGLDLALLLAAWG